MEDFEEEEWDLGKNVIPDQGSSSDLIDKTL
jgi:hypothetical protein